LRLGVLFSGGKDSTFALHKAEKENEIVCLITLVSQNKESYMFHTPNIDITALQAEALGLPLLRSETKGEPEKELEDLEAAIARAVREFRIEGLVTGAVESAYQSQRIQRICDHLKIMCINPLWMQNQKALLEELVAEGFKVIISGVFAYPLDAGWLGKEINADIIARLVQLQQEYGVSPSGEGGEIETTVLDAPLFKKRVEVVDSAVDWRGNCGVYIIKKALLVPKNSQK
jgi:diphthine-ammonia ligase